MAANSHLEWAEIRNFKGLWSRDPFLAGVEYASVMDDCYPQPQGGLRAFFTEDNGAGLAQDGLVFTTDMVSGTGHAGALDSVTVEDYVMMIRVATLVPRLYVNRALRHTHAATARDDMPTYFAPYVTTAPEARVAYNVQGGGADRGIWRLRVGFADIPVKIHATARGPVIAHQSRLVVCSPSRPALFWTDPGTETFAAANFLNLDIGQALAPIVGLVSSAPSDLLVMLSTGQMIAVQGDLSDPITRALDIGPQIIGQPAGASQLGGIYTERLPDGSLIFPCRRQGLFRTSMGTNIEPFSPQLNPQERDTTLASANQIDWMDTVTDRANHLGQLISFKSFLFTPDGYTYDTRTGAWFRATMFKNARHFLLQILPSNPSIHGLPHYPLNVTASNIPGSPLEEGANNDPTVRNPPRAVTYTWTSVPLRRDDGRQIRIREVQIGVRNIVDYDFLENNGFPEYAGVAADVQVTVGGVSVLKTLPRTPGNTGYVLRFLFDAQAQFLDVSVRCRSNDPVPFLTTNLEAPSIDFIRIGSAAGHLL